MLKMLDLFSGIGGFSLAADWTGGIETVAFCEIEPYCQKVLKKHWPDVPIFSDIKELKGDDVGSVDIVCGGFPCQPFSYAGKRRGKADDRHLWPEMFRVIQECKPTWVVGENVPGLIDLALEDCFLDLESEGYEVQPLIIPAAGVGAPHRRKRVWILGYTKHNGLPTIEKLRSYEAASDQWREKESEKARESKGAGRSINVSGLQRCKNGVKYEQNVAYANSERLQGQWREYEPIQKRTAKQPAANCSQKAISEQWLIEPNVGRVAHGIPNRVHRLKALGNSIVPQVAYQILQGIVDIERSLSDVD
jgi:DNA (cytosine-5)-methyltransferase 1